MPTAIKFNNLCIVGLSAALLLAICLFLFDGNYAYFDDYEFVVRGQVPSLKQWLAIGRPGTWFYLETVKETLQGNLPWARAVAAALTFVATIAIYFALTGHGHRPAAAVAFALALPASIPAQLAIVWVNTGSSTVAVLFAVAAYAAGVSTVRRFAASAVLMTIGCLVYPPASCIYFALFLLDWLQLQRGRASLRDVLPFIVGGISLVADFAVAKVAVVVFNEIDSGWTSRGLLLHDIGPKLFALRDGILPFVTNPLFPYVPNLGMLTLYLFGAAMLALILMRRDRSVVAAWTVIVAIGYLIAAGLPVLAVQETWPSYRTFIPWCVLAIYIMVLTAAAAGKLLKISATLTVAACTIAVGGLSATALRQYLVNTEVAQLREFVRQVKLGVDAGHKEFGMVLAPAGPFDERFKTFELGWISASADGPGWGMLSAAEDQMGLARGSLRMVYMERAPKDCGGCYMVDMRPIWQEMFGHYTVERRMAEQLILQRKTGASEARL